jgi:hypothetical protein
LQFLETKRNGKLSLLKTFKLVLPAAYFSSSPFFHEFHYFIIHKSPKITSCEEVPITPKSLTLGSLQKTFHSTNTFHSMCFLFFIYFFIRLITLFIYLVILGFELGTSHLLGRCSTT